MTKLRLISVALMKDGTLSPCYLVGEGEDD
jgi:hypothetical protein